jgi:transcriptional regulator with XRE-family HTH domain
MHINVRVVAALLQLRGISLQALAQFSGVHPQHLALWLRSQQNDETVPFDRQLEILALLGIRNETPRADLVHHWEIVEPLFGTAARTYAPLLTVLDAFGSAEVACLACDTDPAFTLKAVHRYALKFKSGFYALLTVRASPLRNVMFDPGAFTNLSWMTSNVVVLLNHVQYRRLEPGIVSPKDLAGHVDFALEEMKWHNLRRLAAERQVGPAELAQWILKTRHAVPPQPEDAQQALPPTSEASPTLYPDASWRFVREAHAGNTPTPVVASDAGAEQPAPGDVVNIPAFLRKAQQTADYALH